MYECRIFVRYASAYHTPYRACNNPLSSVKDHGIQQGTINRAFEAAKVFFGLPDDKKAALDIKNTPSFKGYNALLTSNNNPEGRGDLHEGFEFGWEELLPKTHDEKRANDGVMAGANVWPNDTDVPGFREAVLTY